MPQLIVITGPRGVGKTILASTYLPPERMNEVYYHDAEDSASKVVSDLENLGRPFGHYERLTARFKDLPGDDDLLGQISKGKLPWVDKNKRSSLVAYYEYIVSDLKDNLTPGKYSVYVHDTLEKLEAGMAAWVEDHKKQAGVTTTAYGKLWSEGVYPLYEQLLVALYARGVETVILCSHLKTPWEGNRPVPGKVTPSGKKLLYRLSSLFLWLVNDNRNSDGAPAALVLKERMGKLDIVDGRWQVRRMLPERVPHCTWSDVRAYLESGPTGVATEVMSATEKGMISELLSDEQLRLMILDAERESSQEVVRLAGGSFQPPNGQPPNGGEVQQIERVKHLASEGKSTSLIANITGMALPVVKSILEGRG